MQPLGGPRPEGWLPDPTGRFEERLVSRGALTRRVRVGAAEAIDSLDADAAVEAAAHPPWEQVANGGSGWRADPTGRFEERWWDGNRLTRRVRHHGWVATDTISPPSRRRLPRPRANGQDPRAPGWRPDPSGDGERFWDGRDWTAKWREAPTRSHRREVLSWLPRSVILALLALFLVALLLGMLVALR